MAADVYSTDLSGAEWVLLEPFIPAVKPGGRPAVHEEIIVDLPAIPSSVKSLVFVVNSFTGQNFSEIENAFCRIVYAQNNEEIARYNLSNTGSHTAQIMAKVYRNGDEWKMHAIGEIASGHTFNDLMPAMLANL